MKTSASLTILVGFQPAPAHVSARARARIDKQFDLQIFSTASAYLIPGGRISSRRKWNRKGINLLQAVIAYVRPLICPFARETNA
jgi:hypothetical protein